MRKSSQSRSYFLGGLAAGVALLVTACSNPASTYEANDYVDSSFASAREQIRSESNQRAEVKAVDVSGEERSVGDGNEWKICTQDIKAGDAVDNGSTVRLGVVRADEECPATGYKKKVEAPDLDANSTPAEPTPSSSSSQPNSSGGITGTYKLPAEKGKPVTDVVNRLTAQKGFAGDIFYTTGGFKNQIEAPGSGWEVCATSPAAGSQLAFGEGFRIVIDVARNC